MSRRTKHALIASARRRRSLRRGLQLFISVDASAALAQLAEFADLLRNETLVAMMIPEAMLTASTSSGETLRIRSDDYERRIGR